MSPLVFHYCPCPEHFAPIYFVFYIFSWEYTCHYFLWLNGSLENLVSETLAWFKLYVIKSPALDLVSISLACWGGVVHFVCVCVFIGILCAR